MDIFTLVLCIYVHFNVSYIHMHNNVSYHIACKNLANVFTKTKIFTMKIISKHRAQQIEHSNQNKTKKNTNKGKKDD